MARRVLRQERVSQPQSLCNVQPDYGFEIVWSAATPRATLVGPRVNSLTSTPSAFFGGISAQTGYAILSANFPCLFSTTWTEVGFVYIDGATPLCPLGVRGTGQACVFSAGSTNAVMWNVADVIMTTSATSAAGWYGYAVRRIGSAHSVYINGRLAGSGSNASSPASNTGILPAIGAQAGSGAEQGSGVLSGTRRVALVARTGRGLSDGACRALSANPWQLFEPQTRSMSWATGTAYMQSVLGSLTLSGLISRRTNKLAVGSTTTSGAITRHTSTREQGSITTSAGPVVGGNFAQSASGSITLSSVLTDAVTFVRSYGSVINLSGALAKPVSKILRGTIALVGSVFKLVTKATFTASMTIAGALSAFSFTPGGGGVLGRGLRFMRKFIGRR